MTNLSGMTYAPKNFNNFKDYTSGLWSNLKNSIYVAPTQEQLTRLSQYNTLMGQGNPLIALFIKSTKTVEAGKASVKGLTASLNAGTVASKAAAFGMKAFGIAANMALTMGIGYAIQFIIEGYQKIVHAQEEAIEKANEVTDTWKKSQDSIKQNGETIKSISSDYEQLSKGIDAHGKNIALSTEEYQKYNSIVNQIAEMFPSMIQGYTDEGNAIIANKGNVEALTEAYKEQKQAAQDAIVLGSNDAWKGFKALSSQDPWSYFSSSGTVDKKSQIEFLKRAISGSLSKSEIENLGTNSPEIKALKEAKLDISVWEFMFGGSEKVLDKIDKDKSLITTYLKQLESHVQTETAKMKPIFAAFLSQDYNFQELDSEAQELVNSIVSTFDFDFLSQPEFENASDVYAWIQNNIISPMSDPQIGQEVQSAVGEIFNNLIPKKDTMASKDWLDALNSELNKLPADLQIKLRLVFSDDINEVEQLESKIKELLGNDALSESLFKNLDISELKTLVNYFEKLGITADDTFDTIRKKIDDFNKFSKITPLDDATNFTGLTSSLNEIQDGVSGITSAMESLRNGTALTTAELAKLALQYPELLNASNLFTDGSVEGQKKMLNSILDIKEQEYDAEIDTKIAELKVYDAALKAQLEVETAKANELTRIDAEVANAKITSEEELQNQLSEYRNLEGRNYVVMEDGKLTTNAEAMSGLLKQTDEGVKKSDPIWESQSLIIQGAFESGGKGGLTALNQTGTKIGNFVTNAKQPFLSLGKTIGESLAGNIFDNGINTVGKIDTNVSGGAPYINRPKSLQGFDTTVGKKDSLSLTIDGSSVSEWVDNQEKRLKERIEQIKIEQGNVSSAISNLQSLKGLDLTTIASAGKGSGGGNSSNKDIVEEYIASIDEYYAAIQRLNSVQEKRESLERDLSNATDYKTKISIQRQLIDVYKQEQSALTDLNKLRADTISSTTSALRKLGFIVEYNAETNNLYIENLEHVNSLTADSKGKYDSLQEATNALRKDTEELIKTTQSLNDENKEASSNISELAYTVKQSKDEIITFIKEIVKEADDALNSIENVYSTLVDAAKSYSETGFMTADTFQAILSLGTEYLSYLYDESGAIKFNEESLQKLIAAKVENLAISQAQSLLDTIKEYKNDTVALKKLAGATSEASTSTWNLIYAQLAMQNLDADLYESFLDQIYMIQVLADNTKRGIGTSAGELTEYYDKASQSLDYILQKTIDLIRYETEEKIKGLNKQLEKYREIINLKKEELNLNKQEDNYNKNVTEKTKNIAQIQSKIDQLSLDNSREAKAERASLIDELKSAQDELNELQSDYAYDSQVQALDKLLEAYEKSTEDKVSEQEDTISSTEKLYNEAIKRIESAWGTSWETLYNDIIGWNTETGSSLNEEITKEWGNAYEAAKKYGSFVEALSKVKDIVGNDGVGNTIGESQIPPPSKDFLPGDVDGDGKVTAADSRLALRASAKLETLSAAQKKAADINGDGKITAEDSRLILKMSAGLPVYHEGGIAGDSPTIKDNEVLAVLEKGESVLNEPKKDAVYKLVDFASVLSKKLGVSAKVIQESPLFRSTSENSIFPNITPQHNISRSESFTFSPEIKVSIVNDGSLSNQSAQKFGDTIANAALDKLSEALAMRGLSGIGNSRTRP
ncbi:MAG: dockerin type I domain-containing protein [Oscillospiraceae bacterium]|jgi:hypothetical protein|nr:dockerin type I domain-containing protein [Oscillospiraceae bacterium]